MKYFLLVTICAYLLNFVNTLEYKEEDTYDYYDDKDGGTVGETPNARCDENVERPKYNVKDAPELFKKFVKDYNKKYYSQADYSKHYYNFVENLKDIIRLNKEGGSSSSDINLWADLGEDEIKSLTGGYKPY